MELVSWLIIKRYLFVLTAQANLEPWLNGSQPGCKCLKSIHVQIKNFVPLPIFIRQLDLIYAIMTDGHMLIKAVARRGRHFGAKHQRESCQYKCMEEEKTKLKYT